MIWILIYFLSLVKQIQKVTLLKYLLKPRCRLDIRKFLFAHRVIDILNSLDESIIACDSINGFKNRIDKFLYGRGFI